MILATSEILEKIAQMFLNFGIKSHSMDDISSELGISKKTLYQYFKNKEDLIRQILHNEIRLRSNEIKVLLKKEGNAIDQLMEIQNLVIQYIQRYSISVEFDLKKYYPAIYDEMRERYIGMLENLFILNIRKGKREKLYRKDLNETIIAKMHTSRILNISQNKVISIEDFTSEEYRQEMICYHLRAMLNEKSIPVLNTYMN